MHFFTLIHISENKRPSHNIRVSNYKKQIELYLNCAKQLYHSLSVVGFKLTIVTNDKSFIQNLPTFEGYLDIVELKFNMSVPININFYSAHFKIEVYQYISNLDLDYVGVLDSDVLCVNTIPEVFKKLIQNKIPLYYNITDQVVSKYGCLNIIKNKELLFKKNSIGIWAGGEFICGTPKFFNKLYTTIESFKDIYFANYEYFCHQGDEMLSSSAIEYLIIHENVTIVDAGSLSLINRFWSYKPLHEQKSIDSLQNYFMLHLPSDKRFISSLDMSESHPFYFFKKYKYYYYKRIILNYFKIQVKFFLK